LSIGEDITEQLEAREELDRNRHELDHLTRAIILGELGSTLAHELNQPLAAILANAQAAQRMLASEPPDLNEVREILADIVAAAAPAHGRDAANRRGTRDQAQAVAHAGALT